LHATDVYALYNLLITDTVRKKSRTLSSVGHYSLTCDLFSVYSSTEHPSTQQRTDFLISLLSMHGWGYDTRNCKFYKFLEYNLPVGISLAPFFRSFQGFAW